MTRLFAVACGGVVVGGVASETVGVPVAVFLSSLLPVGLSELMVKVVYPL